MRSDLRKHRRTVAYFLSLLPLSVYITPAGAQTNFTIDDQAGDELTGVQPTYTPSGDWAQGATCTGCLAKPDPSKAFGGTWHDATYGPGDPNQRAIEISFSGTAVYAFFICANTVEFATTLTNLSFVLDGAPAGTFVHEPKATTDYEYNILGLVNTNIPEGQHQLLIQTTGDQNASLVLFDYLIYTMKQVVTTTTTKTETSTLDSVTSTSQSMSSTSEEGRNTSKAGSSSTLTTEPVSSGAGASSGMSEQSVGTVSSNLTSTASMTETTTSETSSSTPSTVRSTVTGAAPRKTGLIIGAIVGIVAAVAVALLAFICWKRSSSGIRLSLGRSKRRDARLDGSGKEPSEDDTMTPVPYMTGQNRTPDPILSNLATSLEWDSTKRPAMRTDNYNPFTVAVQSVDGPGPQGSDARATSTVINGAAVAADNGAIQKARACQSDIVRQVEEMQQRVATLRSQSTADENGSQQTNAPTGSVSDIASDGEAGMRNKIAALQAEVERLQSQQEYFQHLGWIDEPPPEYVEDGVVGNVL